MLGAFCDFGELGLEDYIINLNWNIKGKVFPQNKHTTGDLINFDDVDHSHTNCFPDKKLYKNFFVESDNVFITSDVDTTTFLSEPKSLIKEFGYIKVLEKQLTEKFTQSERHHAQSSTKSVDANYSQFSSTNILNVSSYNESTAYSSIIQSNYNPSSTVLNFENRINTAIQNIKRDGDILSYKNVEFNNAIKGYSQNSYFSSSSIHQSSNKFDSFIQKNIFDSVQRNIFSSQANIDLSKTTNKTEYHSSITSNQITHNSYFANQLSQDEILNFTNKVVNVLNSSQTSEQIENIVNSYFSDNSVNQRLDAKPNSYFTRYSSQSVNFAFPNYITSSTQENNVFQDNSSYLIQNNIEQNVGAAVNSYFTKHSEQHSVNSLYKSFQNTQNVSNEISQSVNLDKSIENRYSSTNINNRNFASYFEQNNVNQNFNISSQSYFTRNVVDNNISNISEYRQSPPQQQLKDGAVEFNRNNLEPTKNNVKSDQNIYNFSPRSYFEKNDLEQTFNILNDSREFQATQITNLSEKMVSFNVSQNINSTSVNNVTQNEITNIKNEIKREVKQEVIKEIERAGSAAINDAIVDDEPKEEVYDDDEKQNPTVVENISMGDITENNFETIIRNKIEQSNTYSEETLIELEENLKLINNITNNNVTKNELTQVKKEIVEKQELSQKELKKEIEENKNFLSKFLDS